MFSHCFTKTFRPMLWSCCIICCHAEGFFYAHLLHLFSDSQSEQSSLMSPLQTWSSTCRAPTMAASWPTRRPPSPCRSSTTSWRRRWWWSSATWGTSRMSRWPASWTSSRKEFQVLSLSCNDFSPACIRTMWRIYSIQVRSVCSHTPIHLMSQRCWCKHQNRLHYLHDQTKHHYCDCRQW